MLTELPGMLRVFERFFQLEHSESYTYNMYDDARIEGYHYCICHWVQHLKHSWLRTTTHFFNGGNYWCCYLQHWGWAIYKVFDSRARNMYGNCSHSEGTCVLLEIPSMYTLLQYFQSLYRNEDIYELEGVHIANFEVDLFSSSIEYCSISSVNSYQCSCKQCCALAVYAMCYSVINPCGYWTSGTSSTLVSYRDTLYNVMGVKRRIAGRSSSKCQYQCSWDNPYCPGCKHCCPMLQFGWEEVCVEDVHFKTLSWTDRFFVVDWNTLHRLCGSAKK